MTLSQIKCFIAVATNLSFSKAADCLYSSQSAVSKQISALENELGVSLFVRSSKMVTMTTAGEMLLGELSLGMAHIQKGVELCAQAAQGRTGRLRIGSIAQNFDKYLTPLLCAFKSRHPTVLVELVSDRAAKLEQSLESGGLDLIIKRSLGANKAGNRVYKHIYTSPSVLLAPAAHPRARSPKAFFDRIEEETFVFPAPEDYEVNYFDAPGVFTRMGVKIPTIQICPNEETCLLNVEGGLACWVTDSVSWGCDSPNIVFVPTPRPLWSLKHYAVWKNENPNPAIELLAGMLDQTQRKQGTGFPRPD